MSEQPKLSELIRRGAAMVDGQCYGEFVVYDNDRTLCCALGAAYYALTNHLPPSNKFGQVNGSQVLDTFSDYPDVGIDNPLVDWITEHNDAGNSFSEIAEQLEAWGL